MLLDLCWLSGNFPDERLDSDQWADVTGKTKQNKKDTAISYTICLLDQGKTTNNKDRPGG